MAYEMGNRGSSAEQLERIARGIPKQFGIVTGGAVTTATGITVAVAAIAANDYVINGAVQTNAYAGGTVALTAADATNPRIDLITIDTSGTVGKVDGTAAGTCFPPDAGDTKLVLAEILMVANETSLAASDILDKRVQLSPHVIWVQPHGVSASNATLASIADAPYTGALLGTAAADGTAYLVVPVPVNFQGLRAAKIVGIPNGTGNMHYIVATSFAASGESASANTDSISTTLVAVTDNQLLAIDISAAFTGIAAGDFVGVNFTRDGDNAADSITDFSVFGLLFEYF